MELSLQRQEMLASNKTRNNDTNDERLPINGLYYLKNYDAKLSNFSLIEKTSNNPKVAQDFYQMMEQATYLQTATGKLAYQSSPYSIEVEQIKIYKFKHKNGYLKTLRVIVGDLYTVLSKSGQIDAFASVFAVDNHFFFSRVDIRELFDFPPMIAHYSRFKPLAHKARICDSSLIGNPEAERIFFKFIIKPNKKQLIQFKDRDDFGVLSVDILNGPNGLSFTQFVNALLSKKDDKNIHKHKKDVKSKMAKVCINFSENNTTTPITETKARYHGFITYYEHTKFKKSQIQGLSFMQLELMKVRLISWDDLDEIYILPFDNDYIDDMCHFKDDLTEIQERKGEDKYKTKNIVHYNHGDLVLFKNFHYEGIGTWLRGRIVSQNEKTESGVIKFRYNHDCLDQNCFYSEPSTTSKARDKIKYYDNSPELHKVQSIDHGFYTTRTSRNLRPAEPALFKQKHGPWTLRCKLYGVSQPINVKTRPYMSSCRTSINSWIAERGFQSRRLYENEFYVLFRGPINNSLNKDPVPINLLYKRNVSATNYNQYYEFESLSSFLLERGICSDMIPGSMNKHEFVSSQIDLDQAILNSLSKKGCIYDVETDFKDDSGIGFD